MTPRLRIVHVFRAPVGGLFRHVRDLARGQAASGHEVGIICDRQTGGAAAETALAAAASHCALGVHRIAIERLPGLSDWRAAGAVKAICAPLNLDILHGHGAKGGVYARLAGGRLSVPSIYTPHGGSLHYEWNNPKGALFLTAERALLKRGAGLLFVCEHERNLFARKIGLCGLAHKVVHNGLWPEEFAPVAPAADASDVLFIGELRRLKGVGDLIEAISLLARWRKLSATIVGDGPERGQFETQAAGLGLGLGLAQQINFTGQLPARHAFSRGRILAVPSHAESFPYIVLEAVAAEVPIIASNVGGIPEMLPPSSLVPARHPQELAKAIKNRIEALDRSRQIAGDLARDFSRRFDAHKMCANVLAFYREVMNRRDATG